MATKKKLLQAAAGNAGGAALNVEDVFSTYLYNGTATNVAHRIQNGIDLAGEGGLVWIKKRDSNIANTNHYLSDTERGNFYVASNNTNAQAAGDIASYNSDGWTFNASTGLGTDYLAAQSYASWTFRKAPKFFDVVTYTGDGTTEDGSSRLISHNLGSTPGFYIVKRTDGAENWRCFHRSLGATKAIQLDGTGSAITANSWWANVEPTDTNFSVTFNFNATGANYVVYLFAHNSSDGDFGPDADADIIKCGSFTTPSSAADTVINLGFEPQWLLVKSSTMGSPWRIIDVMRGMPVDGGTTALYADQTYSESTIGNGNNFFNLNPTGFTLTSTGHPHFGNNQTHIYIAIRRGTAVPTSATEVFDVQTYTASTGTVRSRNFAPDMLLGKSRTLGDSGVVTDRLRGFLSSNSNSSPSLFPALTNAEANQYPDEYNVNNNSFTDGGYYNNYSLVKYAWKRAPSYMDCVAYLGNSTAGRTVSHNLGVAPEMMWIKGRSAAYDWVVYHKAIGNSKILNLNESVAAYTQANFNNTDPTSSVFTVGSIAGTNASSQTFIAYLFATLAGISKVGSYTGNGTSQTIDCGFTSGARFVLLKRTDSAGDWMLYDSTRGITSTSNDPAIALNNTDAEFTENSFFGADVIRPHSSGFIIDNYFSSSSHNYIFYAIA